MEAVAQRPTLKLRSRLTAIGYARGLRILVGAGMALRLLAAVAHHISLNLSDAYLYNTYAANLVQHGMFGAHVGKPDANIPPGWPMLLAAVYKIVGVHVIAGQALAAALECGTLVFAALIATKLLRPPFALLAVGVLSLEPVWIAWAGTLESEHLALFLATAALAIFVRTELSVKSASAIGVVLGLLALTRAEVAATLFLGLLVAYAARAGFRRGLVAAVVTSAAIAIVLAPWTIRNEARFHELIPSSANGGFNFYLGTLSPYYTFSWKIADLPGTVPPPPLSYPPGRMDDYWWLAGFHRVGWWPVYWLKIDATRLRKEMFYDNEPAYMADVGQLDWPYPHGAPYLPLESYWNPANTLWRIFLFAAIAGGIWTLVRWRRADPAWRAMFVFLVLCTGVHAIFAGDARTHMSLTTALVLLGGLGTQVLWDARQRRRAARTAATT